MVDGLWGPLQLLQTDQLVTLIMNVLLLPGDYASDFDTLLLLQVSILSRALHCLSVKSLTCVVDDLAVLLARYPYCHSTLRVYPLSNSCRT